MFSISSLLSSRRRDDAPIIKQASQSLMGGLKRLSLDNADDPRSRKLSYLIKLYHQTYAVWSDTHLSFPQTLERLCAAYFLGENAEKLEELYEISTSTNEQDAWLSSPTEIAEHDWQNAVGSKAHQRAFTDYFEDQLVAYQYNWKALMSTYLPHLASNKSSQSFTISSQALNLFLFAYALDNKILGIRALCVFALSSRSSIPFEIDPSATMSLQESFDTLAKSTAASSRSHQVHKSESKPDIEDHAGFWPLRNSLVQWCSNPISRVLSEAETTCTSLLTTAIQADHDAIDAKHWSPILDASVAVWAVMCLKIFVSQEFTERFLPTLFMSLLRAHVCAASMEPGVGSPDGRMSNDMLFVEPYTASIGLALPATGPQYIHHLALRGLSGMDDKQHQNIYAAAVNHFENLTIGVHK